MKKIQELFPDIISALDEFEPKREYFEIQSRMHGVQHTRRVMAWTLVLAAENDLVSEGRLAFFAALMHDTARDNDGKCLMHGEWAAERKMPFFTPLFEKHGCTKQEFESIAQACIWHSKWKEPDLVHPDIKVINLLKDADALDRFRLGDDFFDERYLRFPRSKTHIERAREMVVAGDHYHLSDYIRLCCGSPV